MIADSPDNLNPVSWANALMGASYDHATYSKPLADAALAEHRVVSNTEEWYQAPGDERQAVAYYQHNLIKQKNLPLTRPLRDMAQRSPTMRAMCASTVPSIGSTTCCGRSWTPDTTAVSPAAPATSARRRSTIRPPSETAVANPAAAKPKTSRTPVRDAIKTVSEAVKKLTNRLAPKPAA